MGQKRRVRRLVKIEFQSILLYLASSLSYFADGNQSKTYYNVVSSGSRLGWSLVAGGLAVLGQADVGPGLSHTAEARTTLHYQAETHPLDPTLQGTSQIVCI